MLSPLLLAAAIVAGDTAAKRPITHEDVWLMKRLGSAALSPDGRWAVVPVTEPSYEDEEQQVSDLWLVATDGSAAPRRLTATRGSEGGLAWSPDGKRLAFTAKRDKDEASQVYLLDMTGPGEAQRLTSLSTGAANPVFSPDGRRLAFESRVFPGTADDEANQQEAKRRKERKHNASAYQGFPIRHWDHWLDEKQVHLFVQELDPPGAPKDLLAGSELVASPGYAGLPTRSAEELQPTFSPDGASIVFAATTERDRSARGFVAWRLYAVPVGGGEPKRLTPDGWSFARPTFSPDGRALYSRAEPITRFAYNLNRLVRFDWPEPGAPTLVFADFDRSVDEFVIAPDGRSAYLLADEEGRVRVFAAPLAGEGTLRGLDPASGGVLSGLAASSGPALVLVANWEDATHPAELVRIDVASGARRALTAFNVERAATIDWRPFRELWFESASGRRIHSFLALPPGFDESRRYPLLLLIHGGPHSSSQDRGHPRWDPHLLAAPGYVVLMTDYTGSVGYGEAFAQAIQGDPLKTPGDELLQAVEEASRRFTFIDGSRVAAAGASYGGHLVNWLQATSTRFACLVGHAGLVNLESQWGTSDVIYHRELNNGGPIWEQAAIWREQNPIRYAASFKTPVLLTIGEKDYRVPLNQTLEAWSYLKRLEVPSRLVVFHDENHWILKPGNARYFWEELHAWLGEHLKP